MSNKAHSAITEVMSQYRECIHVHVHNPLNYTHMYLRNLYTRVLFRWAHIYVYLFTIQSNHFVIVEQVFFVTMTATDLRAVISVHRCSTCMVYTNSFRILAVMHTLYNLKYTSDILSLKVIDMDSSCLFLKYKDKFSLLMH